MSRLESVWGTPLGKMLLGVIKIALSSFLLMIVSSLRDMAGDVTIGDITIPVGVIIQLLIAFFPVLLLLSAMRDLGIRI